MFDYAETAAEASEAIMDTGARLLLKRHSDGDYDAATSEDQGGTKRLEGFGLLIEYEARHIDGTNILAGDVRILIAVHRRGDDSSLNLTEQLPEPQPGDLVTLEPDTPIAQTWRVVRPKTLKPAMTPVMYEVQARK